MGPKEIKTKEDVIKYIETHISEEYLKACIEVSQEVASNYLIKYPDLAEIKIMHRYLRHCELLLAKAVTCYLIQVLSENGIKCVMNKYNTLYIYSKSEYIHIFDFGTFISLRNIKDGKAKNLYIILANETESILTLINDKNNHLVNSEFETLKRFVCNYLGEDIWNIYFNGLFEALSEKINSNKVFEVSKLYSSYSESDFKKRCLTLLSEFDLSNEVKKTLGDSTYKILKNRFKERVNLLVKESDYGNSFITSEWLFQNLLRDNNLDKTFIVSGYLKSIEQFLFYYANSTGKSVTINKNGKWKKVNPGSDDYTKVTLGNLSHLLKETDCFIDKMKPEPKKQVLQILYGWINDERNGYFHKENINKKEIVISIRQKTFLLYFLLLGALDFSR